VLIIFKNLPDIFKGFSGLINKIPRLSRTAKKKIQDLLGAFQDVATLINNH